MNLSVNKKETAIVFGLTSNLTFAVASVMMDLKRICPDLASEIVILHDGIKTKDRELLNSILPSRFIRYKLPLKYQIKINQKTLGYFTKMVFCKFECLRLLNDYKNVIWLDYDIVLKQSIAELIAPSNSRIKMMFTSVYTVNEQLYKPVDNYDMGLKAISGCIFVFQDNLKDYMKIYQFCYESLIKYGKYLYLGEQAIFDFMIQEFKLNVEPISEHVYSPHPSEMATNKEAKIFHAFGQPKFWNGLHNEQWETNYNNWIKMGGSKYSKDSVFKRAKKKSFSLIGEIQNKI